MIKLSFHICVQKRLVTLSTTPKHIIFSPQIMCHLQYYIFLAKWTMILKIQPTLLLLYYIYILHKCTSKAFFTWAAAYAYTANSEL